MKKTKQSDFAVNAFHTMEQVIKKTETEVVKNPHAVALGNMGGSKGGTIRASKLSPERRAEIARIAAKTRWSKKT